MRIQRQKEYGIFILDYAEMNFVFLNKYSMLGYHLLGECWKALAKKCTTKLTVFIGKLSLEAGFHNPFFPFSFFSLVGRSILVQDSKLLARLDERIEHCRVAYPFNAPEKHTSVSLKDNGPYCLFRYRIVYTLFTVIPVSENLLLEGLQIIEGSQHKITVHLIPVGQKFIKPGSY